MSSAAAVSSVGVPEYRPPEQPELVLKEIRVISDRRLHSQCTIHATINGEEQTRSFSFLDIAGKKELIWKDQTRPISPNTSVVVKWTFGKRKKNAQVTFNHDELVDSARKGDRCERKAEDSTITFIVKLKPLSLDAKKMEDAVKMAERRKSVLDSLEKVQPALKIALKFSDVIKDVHPAVSAALSCVTAVFEALEKEQDTNERVLALAEDIALVAGLLEAIQGSLTLSEVHKVVDRVREIMVAARELVEKRHDSRGFHRVVDVLFSDDDPQVQKLEQLLKDLKATFNIGIGSETLLSIKQLARSDKEDKLVQKVDPGYKLPRERLLRCHPGTREDILSQILRWKEDFDAPNVLWISAYPGTGKTTIASHVASLFAKEKRLGSFFSFNRTTEANTSVLWRMNCVALANAYQPFLAFLFDKLRDFDFNNSTSDEIFDSLIYEPLRSWRASLGSELVFRPPVIVVDALDECADSSERKNVLAAIEKWTQLPSLFKLVVTSRPEADIQRKISSIPHQSLQIYTGTHTRSETHEDIQKFLTSRFNSIRLEYESLDERWVTKDDIADLTRRAAGVFMWAATVAKYVSEDPERLSQILEKDLRDGDLFNLYQVLLDTSFPESTAEGAMETFHPVVGAIVVLQKPVTKVDLCKLVGGMSATSVERVLRGLASVLDGGKHLSFVHQSFVDFLTEHERVDIDNDRSKRTQIECPERFRICTSDANKMLFESTFTYMAEKLKFNICRIPSSFELDSPSSRARVDVLVEEILRYACQFWGFHISAWLSKSFPEHTLVSARVPLADFVEKKLLFWLEMLSGTGAYHVAFPSLLQLRDSIRSGHVKDSQTRNDVLHEIIALLSDSLQFCRYFGPVISSSVPHIYLSALPFAPTSSIVAKTHATSYGNCLKLIRGQISRWPALQIAIQNGSKANSIVFSPDGKRVASGSADETIRLWDAETGQAIAEPFRGHEDRVRSVAFSPDGKRIASGSDDGTVRLWDAETGQAIAEPFRGHEYYVFSVAFSPDGKCIASGSIDGTIRLWGVETGQAIAEPFRSHEGFVTSIAFSPDGKRIASGSYDKMVRLWDVETGQAIAEPFRGHEYYVLSVAFSPDGKCIASGSGDGTVRLWDVGTGQAIAEPFHGHEGYVRSVAFSPDGKRVASGSSDKTVRLWDVETGQAIAEPFHGHEDHVRSVAFSPDGKRIASGSVDGTVRLWDAETEQAIAEPFRGYEDYVTSVAFSPDGKCIASGSSDKTVQLWDVETGQAIAEPFHGHEYYVLSVAFSPDGECIASGSGDKTVRLWDVETGQAIAEPFHGHEDHVRSVVFSPDGKCIASGSDDKTVRLWDAETGQAIAEPFRGHEGHVFSVAFSPDGERIASGSGDKTVRLWDAETGQAIARPFHGHEDYVRSIAFSPDGKRIASGSYDKTVRIWDVETGQAIAEPFRGHESYVYSVAFSPDGKHIASGSADRTIRIWEKSAIDVTKSTHSQQTKASMVTAAEFTAHSNCFPPGFSYHSAINNSGWVLGDGGLPLFWVPPLQRAALYRPSNIIVIGSHAVQLDFTNAVWGENWTDCYTANEPVH